jgi:hypothetical protein
MAITTDEFEHRLNDLLTRMEGWSRRLAQTVADRTNPNWQITTSGLVAMGEVDMARGSITMQL